MDPLVANSGCDRYCLDVDRNTSAYGNQFAVLWPVRGALILLAGGSISGNGTLGSVACVRR
jgi:hypothetical protein